MDLDFIAGNYLYGDLPQNKEYLAHYFDGPIEKAFLSYFFTFPMLYQDTQFQTFYKNFCDHTGHSCSTRWVHKLLVRLDKIEKALEEAGKNVTEESLQQVAEIKSGKASF